MSFYRDCSEPVGQRTGAARASASVPLLAAALFLAPVLPAQADQVIADDLIVDTHGADVIDTVWRLLGEAYDHFGVFPTLLERDFNFPPLDELLLEVDHIGELQEAAAAPSAAGTRVVKNAG